MAAATTTSVSAECPEYILFLFRILIVTSPNASIPSVTDFTENSINSLGTCANAFSASQTASTGPVPTATAVSSVWVFCIYKSHCRGRLGCTAATNLNMT